MKGELKEFSRDLVNPAGNDQYYHSAYSRGNQYWQPLCTNDVEIEHQRHCCRDKEESEIFHKEISHAFNLAELYSLNLKQKGENQHSDNARRKLDAGEPH